MIQNLFSNVQQGRAPGSVRSSDVREYRRWGSCPINIMDPLTRRPAGAVSHPNLGVFFSGTDRKTQKDFFDTEYSLGLVVDPVRDEELWFFGGDSQQLERKSILKY